MALGNLLAENQAVGIHFYPLPEGPEEEQLPFLTLVDLGTVEVDRAWMHRDMQDALRLAAQQDHQAIFALGLACTHLAEENAQLPNKMQQSYGIRVGWKGGSRSVAVALRMRLVHETILHQDLHASKRSRDHL